MSPPKSVAAERGLVSEEIEWTKLLRQDGDERAARIQQVTQAARDPLVTWGAFFKEHGLNLYDIDEESKTILRAKFQAHLLQEDVGYCELYAYRDVFGAIGDTGFKERAALDLYNAQVAKVKQEKCIDFFKFIRANGLEKVKEQVAKDLEFKNILERCYLAFDEINLDERQLLGIPLSVCVAIPAKLARLNQAAESIVYYAQFKEVFGVEALMYIEAAHQTKFKEQIEEKLCTDPASIPELREEIALLKINLQQIIEQRWNGWTLQQIADKQEFQLLTHFTDLAAFRARAIRELAQGNFMEGLHKYPLVVYRGVIRPNDAVTPHETVLQRVGREFKIHGTYQILFEGIYKYEGLFLEKGVADKVIIQFLQEKAVQIIISDYFPAKELLFSKDLMSQQLLDVLVPALNECQELRLYSLVEVGKIQQSGQTVEAQKEAIHKSAAHLNRGLADLRVRFETGLANLLNQP